MKGRPAKGLDRPQGRPLLSRALGSVGSLSRAWDELMIEPMEVSAMAWETPEFVEVKMDAEINSYQDDFEREQDERF